MTGIADTGFLVAFLNRRDRFHSWAVELASDIDSPLFTCEAVLAETVFHTGSAASVLHLIREGLISLRFDVDAHQERLDVLARRYADRNPDLADLCLICMSEQFVSRPVITVDGDFKIYRRHQREVIPVFMPPLE